MGLFTALPKEEEAVTVVEHQSRKEPCAVIESGVVLVNALTLGPAFLHPRMVGGVPGEHTADAQEPVVAESNTEAESVIILSQNTLEKAAKDPVKDIT